MLLGFVNLQIYHIYNWNVIIFNYLPHHKLCAARFQVKKELTVLPPETIGEAVLRCNKSPSILPHVAVFVPSIWGITATHGGMVGTGKIDTVNTFPIGPTMKLFEELIKMERENFKEATSGKKTRTKK